ncbi:methylase involved in ubiquinone/menaquinone biosynthesis [Aciduliprofundum sp. MAR08-339]|uniref:class I SAM-dependent methyltransferase n=1 Tax=Aciduliprofundum sp. (strain MAR08-339) TaxID=673860 RepID=UPI0002A4AA94|nr:methylase involved in ubiquinone/menaquinone biosynthesis [Aciduliprofundum sp. MAR08-339]
MDFYDVEADLYDLFYFDFQDDIEIYRKYAKECDSLLELMCGTGRILYYLDHPNMWGIDSNEKMLARARENLKGKNVKLVKGDVLNFSIPERFCLVLIGLNSLTMFPKEERLKILKNANAHLESGGRIIVDIFNPFEMVEGIVHHGDTIFRDDRIYSRFFVPVKYGNRWKLLYFYDTVENEILRRRFAEMYIYPIEKEEIVRELEDVGFEIEDVYGDYEMNEFDEYSERIIVVGVKR